MKLLAKLFNVHHHASGPHTTATPNATEDFGEAAAAFNVNFLISSAKQKFLVFGVVGPASAAANSDGSETATLRVIGMYGGLNC